MEQCVTTCICVYVYAYTWIYIKREEMKQKIRARPGMSIFHRVKIRLTKEPHTLLIQRAHTFSDMLGNRPCQKIRLSDCQKPPAQSKLSACVS